MSATPNFTHTPVVGMAQISTANTNRDGTGTLVDVVTGDATYGTRIDRVIVKATGTTTAGLVRLFLYDGVNNRLWREIAITAATPAAAVAAFLATLTSETSGLPLVVLPPNWKIRAAPHNAETFNVYAEGGNLDE